MKENRNRSATELKRLFNQGKISRRDFIRASALLSLSLGVSEILAACGVKTTSTPWPTAYDPAQDDPTMIEIGKSMGVPGSSSEAWPTSETGLASGIGAEPHSTATPAKKVPWLCVSCGLTFPNVEELKKHVVAIHAKRLPEIHRVDQPTYTEFLVEPMERFDERNTVFSRALWDTNYQALINEASAKASQGDWDTFEGRALVAGAIYVDDTAGALHENYTGYMGHVGGDAGLYGWENPVNSTRMPVSDPAWMTERVKTAARFYGSDLVGVTEVNPLWVYSHYFERATGNYGELHIPYKYAIIMGIEMDWETINQSPKPPASAATALAYSRMAELAASLAKYIRALGYAAIPCGNDTAQSIPLAIDAGLGELGRNGLLISPEFGPRQRLCKVFTDLPLVSDKPIDFGMRSYCETCHACAQSCPARAILRGDRTTETTSISNRKGILRWPVDVAKCYLFWRENGTDCSNCVAACPWALRSTRDWLEL